MCNRCRYFVGGCSPIRYILIGIGMYNNEDSDHYKHILSNKHPKCICYRDKEIEKNGE